MKRRSFMGARRGALVILVGLGLGLVSIPAAAQEPVPDTRPWPPALLTLAFERVPVAEVLAAWPAARGLQGEAYVEASVALEPEGLVHVWTATVPELRHEELRLGAATIRVSRPFGDARSAVRINVVGPLATTLEASFELPLTLVPAAGTFEVAAGAVEGVLKLRGLDLSRWTEAWPSLAVSGRVDLDMTVAGTTTDPSFEAELFGSETTFRGEQVGIVAGRWVHQSGKSTLEVRQGTPEAPVAAAMFAVPLTIDLARGDLTWRDAEPHSFWLTARGLNETNIRPLWRPPLAARFEVDVLASGEGTLDKLKVEGSVRGRLQDRDKPPLPIEVDLQADARKQALRFGLGDGMIASNWTLKAPLAKLRRTPMTWESVPVEGAFHVAIPFETIGPYLPKAIYDPRGEVLGDVQTTGTLGAPKLKGTLQAAAAALTIVPLNQRLTELKLAASLEGQTLIVQDLSARSGAGRCEGSAVVQLELTPADHATGAGLWDDWKLTSTGQLTTTAFPFTYELVPGGEVDGELRYTATASAGDTDMDIAIDKTRVRLGTQGMPAARPIPRNPAIRRLDWRGEPEASDSVFAGLGHLNVRVELLQPIHVTGAGADIELAGKMVVDRQDDLATVDGGFRALPGGTFRLFANTFTVKTGTLTLRGGDIRERDALGQGDGGAAMLADPDAPAPGFPLEPELDITARGFVVDTHVLVKVLGPARRPELVLLSSPPLPEYQVMTLLIIGRVDSIDERNGQVRREVAKLVSTFHNPGLSRQLYDRIGVDKIGFGFGGAVSQPVLTVGKQVNRQLYVETVYHHNAPVEVNRTEGRVEYRLNPWWTFDTAYGDAGIGSVGVFWGTNFGGPVPPEPPENWGEAEPTEQPPAEPSAEAPQPPAPAP